MTPALGVNVFTGPEKAVVGERPRPFGPPMAFDPMTSTLIFGENDAVLVDTLTTTAEAEALASWIALHHRNLTTIYGTAIMQPPPHLSGIHQHGAKDKPRAARSSRKP